MMKKIVLIAPFFGKLPKESFQLTLNSCKFNETIDWIIFTDDETKYDYPKNVKVVYQTWPGFAKLIKFSLNKKFHIEAILKDPYKLNDYKPLYGDLFPEYIRDYDFWGYTDISDVIYGNLRKFLVEKDLAQFEKINFLGHFTLFKNDRELNQRYSLPLDEGGSITEILKSTDNYAFDEFRKGSIHKIYIDNGFPFKRLDEMVADISPLRFAFQLSKFDDNYNQYYESFTKKIFSFKEGELLEWQLLTNSNVTYKEVGYVHFQKRKLKSKINLNQNSFLMTPYGFTDYQHIDVSVIKNNAPRKIYLPFFKLKWRALLKKLKK